MRPPLKGPEIQQRVQEAAEILGIQELLQRKPRALSGGQRQRVAVGRAIVRKPQVFLFDEPLSNLDAKLRVAMRAELKKLHDRLQATVVSTRAGWTGDAWGRSTQAWLGATYWDTFATPTGTVADPDGGTLRFDVDQGPRWAWTYSIGGHVNFGPRIEAAIDIGTDMHGGWSLALIPAFRF